MLQWMGGSRRKVTTSRKSSQKRQKQYFEQRRRQQQQQGGGFESYEEEGDFARAARNSTEPRSLDILSLRSLSSVSQDRKPACPVGTEAPKVNASPAAFHAGNDSQIIFPDPASLKVMEARTTLDYHAEPSSSRSAPITPPNSKNHAFKGNDKKSFDALTATQQPLGFFYLLGDDVANEHLEVNPVYESHAAFSVEGLGQVDAETPPYSPQQPDRYASYGCSSPLKATRHLNTSKYLHCVPDDLEVQVDSIMQDSDRPLCGSLNYSTGVASAYGPNEKNAFSSKSQVHDQFDGSSRKLRRSFVERKIFGETANSNVNIWDERSSLFDDNSLCEWAYDMPWDRWPRQLDGDYDEFLKYGGVDMSDYAFEGPNLPRKWAARKPTCEVNIFDSPPEKQTSGYCSKRTNFDIRDATGGPEWSRFMTEDGKDNFSLSSDYSCSSTAGEATANQLPSSAARSNRRHLYAFSGSDHGGKFDFATLNRFEKANDTQKQNSGPGKSRWMPTRWESKSTQQLNYDLQDPPGPHASLFSEEGNGSADMHLSLSSSCQSSEIKSLPFGREPWAEETISAFPAPRPCFDYDSYLDGSKHGSPFKYSPSGSIISEKLAFCKSSSNKHFDEFQAFSKVHFVPTKPEFSPDSPGLGFEVRPPDSCLDAASHGEIPNLSAQESVSKDDKNRSKSKQGNHEKAKPHKENPAGQKEQRLYVVDFEENGPEFKETKDGPLDTSSSMKISDRSESSVDGRRYQHDAEVSLPHPKGKEDVENSSGPNPNGNEITETSRQKEKKTRRDSSPQLMLEGYILQLLRIKKKSEEASAVTPR